jgi:hypothetical protein
VLEAEVKAVAIQSMVVLRLVVGLVRDPVPVSIAQDHLTVMVGLLLLGASVVAVAADKVRRKKTLVAMVPEVARDPALVRLVPATHPQLHHRMQVQTLLAMVVAWAAVAMVGLVVVKATGLDSVKDSLEGFLQCKFSSWRPKDAISLSFALQFFSFFLPLFCTSREELIMVSSNPSHDLAM